MYGTVGSKVALSRSLSSHSTYVHLFHEKPKLRFFVFVVIFYVPPNRAFARNEKSESNLSLTVLGARVRAYMRLNGRLWFTNYRWLDFGHT